MSNWNYFHFSFDIEKNTWEPLESLNVARFNAVATAMNGYIYVGGGTDGQHDLDSVEMYDPKSDVWVQLPQMNSGGSVHSLVNSEGFLYAIRRDTVIERFDSLKSEWKEVHAK